MKRMIFAAAILCVTVASAMPQEAKRVLTINEVVEIGNALRGLKTYTTQDRAGNAIVLSYKFDGPALLTMANNIRKADDVAKFYIDTVNTLIGQLSDGGTQVPPEKMREYSTKVSVINSQPATVELGRLKISDLNLSEQPFPPATITTLLPILDK